MARGMRRQQSILSWAILGGGCLLVLFGLTTTALADRAGNKDRGGRDSGDNSQSDSSQSRSAPSSPPAGRSGQSGSSNAGSSGHTGYQRSESRSFAPSTSGTQAPSYRQPTISRSTPSAGNLSSGSRQAIGGQSTSGQSTWQPSQPRTRTFLNQAPAASNNQSSGTQTSENPNAAAGNATLRRRGSARSSDSSSSADTVRTGTAGAVSNPTVAGNAQGASSAAAGASTTGSDSQRRVGPKPSSPSGLQASGSSSNVSGSIAPKLPSANRVQGTLPGVTSGTGSISGAQTQQGAGQGTRMEDVRRRLGAGNNATRAPAGNVDKPIGKDLGKGPADIKGPAISGQGAAGTGANTVEAGKSGTLDLRGPLKGAGKDLGKGPADIKGPTISGQGAAGTGANTVEAGKSGTLDLRGPLKETHGRPGLETKGVGGADLKLGKDLDKGTAGSGVGTVEPRGGSGKPDQSLHLEGPQFKTPGGLSNLGEQNRHGDLEKRGNHLEDNERLGMAKPKFHERVEKGELDAIAKSKVGNEIKLADQYRLAKSGDVARRLDLHKSLPPDQKGHDPGGPDLGPSHPVAGKAGPEGPGHHDGPPPGGHPGPHPYHHHHHPYFVYFGVVAPVYYTNCLEFSYFGPSWYASAVWYPHWTPWVSWAWHYHPHPIWDPRPIWCRPVVYAPAPVWVYWQPPVWTPLPEVASGTWVDVNRVVLEPERRDLQLLAVRFVDPGHPEEKLGPRYRVWFRNNGDRPLQQAFNVVLMASDDGRLRPGLPQAGVRVTAIDPGDTQSVDIRLPFEVYDMKKDAAGKPVPFSTLHVLVDANREIDEVTKDNNGVALAPADVLPVDPAAFQVDPAQAGPGAEILLAGEGLGPEPGKVLVHAGNADLEAEILGWYDLGIRLKLPELPPGVSGPVDLVVVRGDGAAANPLSIVVEPGGAMAAEAPALPAVQ